MTDDGTAAATSVLADPDPIELMAGFPPAPECQVSVANWQQPQYLQWAFQHMREFIPSQLISVGPKPRRLPRKRLRLDNPRVVQLDGDESTVEDVIAATHTDALLVLHEGAVVHEEYFGAMTATTRHLIMSMSKSIVGCVAGVLVNRGQLDPLAVVTDYVPEVSDSGYCGATVRDLLDMRTGVGFEEAYTDNSSEARVMERSTGWAPPLPADPQGTYAYLVTLGSSGPHGEGFVYRSADTDMLGWVCERAAGARMADLISTLIWQPMGAEADAEITCDAVGTALHDGGVSARLRDMGRFGQLLLDGGIAGGRQVVPAAWLAETFAPEPGVREAFAGTNNELMLPGGWYRNQFWFFNNGTGPILLCLGIHGQLIYVDQASQTVIVKFSSWPDAQNSHHLANTLRSCTALAASL